MSDKPSIGAGDVEIVINGETKVLRPTFRAAKMISRQSGGYMGAVQSIANLDIDAIVYVIKQGLGLTDHGAESLAENVWRTGAAKLAAPCIRYLHVLSNGGRPPADEEQGGDPDKAPLA